MSVLCVDFDDVINGPAGALPGAVEGMVELRRRGYEIVVLTAQADLDSDVGVNHWLRVNWPANAGEPPIATNVKCGAVAYIDDKAFHFTDWPSVLAAFTGGDR